MNALEALKIARGRIHDDELPASEAVCVLDSLIRQVDRDLSEPEELIDINTRIENDYKAGGSALGDFKCQMCNQRMRT